MKNKVLIIEDDEEIVDILRFKLMKEGFDVKTSPFGEEAESLILEYKPNLILLDIMLGDTDGFSVCRTITKYKIPIIFLTARNDVIDKIVGLELGAEDYITKPFDLREVMARIRVALRREINLVTSQDENIIDLGEVKINKGSYKVYICDQEIMLKPKEIQFLIFLSENKNQVFTRDQLLEKVWGFDYLGDSRTIDVHVNRLRKKLLNKVNIETVFSVGYMLKVWLWKG